LKNNFPIRRKAHKQGLAHQQLNKGIGAQTIPPISRRAGPDPLPAQLAGVDIGCVMGHPETDNKGAAKQASGR
jgi:hypothetical protein